MVSYMKLITLSKSMFSRSCFCFLWNLNFGLFIFVSTIFVISVVDFCVVFNFLISSFSSFKFCCYLSLLALLVLKMILDKLFPCFWCSLFGLLNQSLLCMLGLVLLFKLIVMFCLLEGLQLFSIFQQMLAFL